MKKIIAILLALAVVSMAFAQTVSVTNTVSTEPQVYIDGGASNGGTQWRSGDPTLREEVAGTASTEDGRAKIWARARFNLEWRDGLYTDLGSDSANRNLIASLTPRWVMKAEATANALVKPFEFLEVGVGKDFGDGVADTSMGPGFAWETSMIDKANWKTSADGAFKPYAVWGDRQKAVREGIYGAFVGVPGLKVVLGIDTKGLTKAFDDKEQGFSLIKKNAYGTFGVGAKYSQDMFDVGASVRMTFGAAEYQRLSDGTTVDYEYDKQYSNMSIYVGGTFKGLQSLPVGITLDAKVAFTMNNGRQKANDIAVGVGADFDFKNGISDKVDLTVGFAAGGNSYKVLPFYVGNTLTYKPSDETKFTLLTGYAQMGLKDSMKTYTQGTGTGDTGLRNGVLSTLTLKPQFEFTMGRHTFSFGVATYVNNQALYEEKTDTDWAYTRLYGRSAVVKFPVSWKYQF